MLPPGGAVPPQPETFSDMPSNPALQPEDRLPYFGQPEIIPPAAYVAAPGVSQLVTGSTLVPPPHLPHLCFESRDTLRRYSDPPLAIQSKAQEPAFPNPPRPAFRGVHLQSQMLLNPVLYRAKRAFRRLLTAYVDVAVVGVPAIAMPSPVQFFIERIQIDVGQQRRQRPALRRALPTRLH